MCHKRKPTFVELRCGAVSRRRATSLIELLVVIGIMAILLTMLVPSLQRTITLAQKAVCMHNLRQISQGLQLYRVENDGWLPGVQPPKRHSYLASDEPVDTNENVWFLKLFPNYLPDLAVLTCPEDPFRYRMAANRDLMNDPHLAEYSSYGINSFIMTAGRGYLADLDRRQPTRPLNTILVADLGPDYGHNRGSDNRTGGPKRNSSMLSWDDKFDAFVTVPDETWVTVRHGNGINIATVGGGVESANTEVLMRRPLATRYRQCGAGGCTLCSELQLYHYSFAHDRLYWWTGSLPAE